MESPDEGPSSSSAHSTNNRQPNPNRHGHNDIELRDIILTVEQDVSENENSYDNVQRDLGNPQRFKVFRRENEGTRPLFSASDVLVNAIEHNFELRLERGTSLRPRSRSGRTPSPRNTRNNRKNYRRSPSYTDSSDNERSSRTSRKRTRYSPTSTVEGRRSSSVSSCDGNCDDPMCGKEFLLITDEVKRCLVEHPIHGRGFFLRDPSMDTNVWYTPGTEENYMYPSTYDIGATNAMFHPLSSRKATRRRGIFSGRRRTWRSTNRQFNRYKYFNRRN